MNKLILVGNGFDLAHNLPTSYSHFINDFWSNIHLNYKKDVYKEILLINESYSRIFNHHKKTENYKDFQENLVSYQNEYSNEIEPYSGQLKLRKKNTIIFKFNNDFFHEINLKFSIENWVDIENEYYLQLKKKIRLKFGNHQDEELQKVRMLEVVKLNKEFEALKNLFEEYLLESVNKVFDFNKIDSVKEWSNIEKTLKPTILVKGPYLKEQVLALSKEFSRKEDKEIIRRYNDDVNNKPLIFKSFILSFNYTPTVHSYNQKINKDFGSDICSCNYIHGELKSTKNKTNFGFGDEIDSFYKEIENIGENEYLKNFKSFQYSNTQNYDDLLRYIDSDKFQVYVLGHSCGLSDRVLLNTIFEHDNCRSIKVYFHKKDENNNNYTDIVQNISRHFDDKPSMRRKIVNKTLCTALPQNVRFQKK